MTPERESASVKRLRSHGHPSTSRHCTKRAQHAEEDSRHARCAGIYLDEQ
ncbi:uncharacterized protein V6R79_021247 [Siganus canaliculatus]